MLNINTSSTWPHNMVNFGLQTAEICWRVWGTPANFTGFRILTALLHCTLVRCSFFSTEPRDWLARTSLKWPILCRVGR